MNLLGNLTVDITQVVKQATEFMAACLGMKEYSSITQCRQCVWAQKTDRSFTALKQCWLPFYETILPALQQVASCWDSLHKNLHQWTQSTLLWSKSCQQMPQSHSTNMCQGITFTTLPLLKLTYSKPLWLGKGMQRKLKCGCMSWQLPCTIFSICCASFALGHNPFNKEDTELGNQEE